MSSYRVEKGTTLSMRGRLLGGMLCDSAVGPGDSSQLTQARHISHLEMPDDFGIDSICSLSNLDTTRTSIASGAEQLPLTIECDAGITCRAVGDCSRQYYDIVNDATPMLPRKGPEPTRIHLDQGLEAQMDHAYGQQCGQVIARTLNTLEQNGVRSTWHGRRVLIAEMLLHRECEYRPSANTTRYAYHGYDYTQFRSPVLP